MRCLQPLASKKLVTEPQRRLRVRGGRQPLNCHGGCKLTLSLPLAEAALPPLPRDADAHAALDLPRVVVQDREARTHNEAARVGLDARRALVQHHLPELHAQIVAAPDALDRHDGGEGAGLPRFEVPARRAPTRVRLDILRRREDALRHRKLRAQVALPHPEHAHARAEPAVRALDAERGHLPGPGLLVLRLPGEAAAVPAPHALDLPRGPELLLGAASAFVQMLAHQETSREALQRHHARRLRRQLTNQALVLALEEVPPDVLLDHGRGVVPPRLRLPPQGCDLRACDLAPERALDPHCRLAGCAVLHAVAPFRLGLLAVLPPAGDALDLQRLAVLLVFLLLRTASPSRFLPCLVPAVCALRGRRGLGILIVALRPLLPAQVPTHVRLHPHSVEMEAVDLLPDQDAPRPPLEDEDTLAPSQLAPHNTATPVPLDGRRSEVLLSTYHPERAVPRLDLRRCRRLHFPALSPELHALLLPTPAPLDLLRRTLLHHRLLRPTPGGTTAALCSQARQRGWGAVRRERQRLRGACRRRQRASDERAAVRPRPRRPRAIRCSHVVEHQGRWLQATEAAVVELDAVRLRHGSVHPCRRRSRERLGPRRARAAVLDDERWVVRWGCIRRHPGRRREGRRQLCRRRERSRHPLASLARRRGCAWPTESRNLLRRHGPAGPEHLILQEPSCLPSLCPRGRDNHEVLAHHNAGIGTNLRHNAFITMLASLLEDLHNITIANRHHRRVLLLLVRRVIWGCSKHASVRVEPWSAPACLVGRVRTAELCVGRRGELRLWGT